MKKIALIAGARPNFMKVAPLVWEMRKQDVSHILVNTGQHFSTNMSEDFFQEFDIRPDYSFTPSRESVVRQIADIMSSLEDVFTAEAPSEVVVVGDVNSTLAGAIVANKMGIPLVHLEAGLRSHNRAMPEEHNRVLTDHLADMLLVTSEDGVKNLKKECVTKGVYEVGNIMIDTLVHFLPQVKSTSEQFYFCTLHRAENIDNKEVFGNILNALEEISRDTKIYLPLHPRTKKMAEKFGYLSKLEKICTLLDPLRYTESLYYQKNAQLVLTDSGGVQEETSYLGTPCITLRTETERPVTVTQGTNVIGGVSKEQILETYRAITKERRETSIPLWDGNSAERIVGYLCQ